MRVGQDPCGPDTFLSLRALPVSGGLSPDSAPGAAKQSPLRFLRLCVNYFSFKLSHFFLDIRYIMNYILAIEHYILLALNNPLAKGALR
jgi:hypothetical protein